ncbi:ParB/RepB/Spo0J family partition protein [Photobacterium alginatilyticum]|uniref:ParB/RepB/Spo0J family partition protein n=1 Tax=Photobacterium alginatilyticum TaxID=1775171 RepID=A0ABW9YFG0_9GAMM|nr:ParB/RepB/Spo0J family partition protein [Photobacterium alginatilyticum]NBI52527.1 ParB/RepB/Spo0J family partition protein [Photobacterium alginatilyticum]
MEKKPQEPSEIQGIRKVKAVEKTNISESMTRSTTSEILKSRLSTVYLNINNKKVEFRLVEIAPDEVITKTTVTEENQRDQRFVNALSVRELTAKIREKGQVYPAIGQAGPQGKIEIIDGSQRRMACHLAGKPFSVYVCKGTIDHITASQLSNDTNLFKPLSLIERGMEWKTLLQNKKYKNASALAKENGINVATVSIGLKAAALPSWLINIIPSPSDLGKDLISKLDKSIRPLTQSQLRAKKEDCENAIRFLENEIAESSSAQSANSLVVNALIEVFSVGNDNNTTGQKYRKLENGSLVKASVKAGRIQIDIKNASKGCIDDLTDVLNRHGMNLFS